MNLFYWFADVTDTKDTFRATYWYDRDGKTDGGTVDLLPMRLQAFGAKPGLTVRYRVLDGDKIVKQGKVTADARGVYRVPQAPADKKYILELSQLDQ